jgi:hypothetical protein
LEDIDEFINHRKGGDKIRFIEAEEIIWWT